MTRRGVGAILGLALAAGLPGCGRGAAARGQQVYQARGCAACHGPQGRGDGPSAPRLDRRPRDFADPRGYRNGAGQDQIAASMRGGAGARPPFRDLTDAEAQDIAAWIVTLQREPGTR